MATDVRPLSDFKPHPDEASCQSIDWYSEGQTRIVEFNGMQIVVRFVGRRGRRGRIAILAPAGAVFQDAELRGKLDDRG